MLLRRLIRKACLPLIAATFLLVISDSTADVPDMPHFCLTNACFAFFEGNYRITETVSVYDRINDTEAATIFFDGGIVVRIDIGKELQEKQCRAGKDGVVKRTSKFASGAMCLAYPSTSAKRSRAVYITIVATSEPSQLDAFMAQDNPGIWSVEAFPRGAWSGGKALRIGKEQHMYLGELD